MKSPSILILILPGLLFLYSCNKNKEEVQPDQEYHFIITLQNDRILSYQKYNGTPESLIEEATYQYTDDLIVKTLLKGDDMKRKTFYHLEDGVAKTCFDTIYRNNMVSEYSHHVYTHIGGRLTKDEFENKFWDDDLLIAVNWIYEYMYNDDGNMIILHKTLSDGDHHATCYDEMKYNDLITHFDVNDFDAQITGAVSTNMKNHMVYDAGCPGGPGWTYSSGSFSYMLNGDGYIDAMTENYSSGYRITSNTYEYIFN